MTDGVELLASMDGFITIILPVESVVYMDVLQITLNMDTTRVVTKTGTTMVNWETGDAVTYITIKAKRKVRSIKNKKRTIVVMTIMTIKKEMIG